MQIEKAVNTQNVVQNKSQLKYLQQFINDQNSRFKLSEDYMFLKVVIGKYFIQSFRVFKLLPEIDSVILWKRQNNQTHYNFFVILKSLEDLVFNENALLYQEQDQIKRMKKSVQKLIRKELLEYSISMALVKEMKKIGFPTYQKYKEFLSSLSCKNSLIVSKIMSSQSNFVTLNEESLAQTESYDFQVESFEPKLKKENEEILYQNTEDLVKLKELISVYIDTFANQEKGGYIYKQIDKSSGSFSVDLLLNTVNYIIYEEMNGSCYSQIEPCYWTCFESSTKKLNSDRKHITLSGSGQICILQIIFLRDLESENKTEYSMMLTDMKKFYRRVKIKTYRITNEKWNGFVEKIDLEEDQILRSTVQPIIYKFNCSTACQFP